MRNIKLVGVGFYPFATYHLFTRCVALAFETASNCILWKRSTHDNEILKRHLWKVNFISFGLKRHYEAARYTRRQENGRQSIWKFHCTNRNVMSFENLVLILTYPIELIGVSILQWHMGYIMRVYHLALCKNYCFSNYRQISNISRTIVGNKIVNHSDVVGAFLSALLQLHLHSRLHNWIRWIGQRQLLDETGSISVLEFGATYIRGLMVYINNIHRFIRHNSARSDADVTMIITRKSKLIKQIAVNIAKWVRLCFSSRLIKNDNHNSIEYKYVNTQICLCGSFIDTSYMCILSSVGIMVTHHHWNIVKPVCNDHLYNKIYYLQFI